MKKVVLAVNDWNRMKKQLQAAEREYLEELKPAGIERDIDALKAWHVTYCAEYAFAPDDKSTANEWCCCWCLNVIENHFDKKSTERDLGCFEFVAGSLDCCMKNKMFAMFLEKAVENVDELCKFIHEENCK